MRILYGTDLHGSTMVMRKLLTASREFDADLIVLGGDIAGKRLVPLVRNRDGTFTACEPYRQKDDTGHAIEEMKKEVIQASALQENKLRMASKGMYWHEVASFDEVHSLNQRPAVVDDLFRKKIVERFVSWARDARTVLGGDIPVFWTGGNDDEQVLLDAIAAENTSPFSCVEEKVVEIGTVELLSFGHSNITPFETARECTEEQIAERLHELVKQAKTTDRLILNVHVPPKDCGTLDAVLESDGYSGMRHVGSSAVRAFIEDIQPMVHFCGHIHEGKGSALIGRTRVFNPGSDYYAGILQGYLVVTGSEGLRDYHHFMR